MAIENSASIRSSNVFDCRLSGVTMLSKYTIVLCLLAYVNIWFGAFSYGHVGTVSSPPRQVKLDYDNDNGPRMMRYKCLDKWLTSTS